MPATQTIEIVNPVAPPPTLRVLEPDKPSGLVGKRVGFRVQWKKFEVFCKELETILREGLVLPDAGPASVGVGGAA